MVAPVVAVGLAVIGTAVCVSWVFNQMTESERREQRRLREKQSRLRGQYARSAAEAREERLAQQRRHAESIHEAYSQAIATFRKKDAEIADGIEKLRATFLTEMAADTTSPYRKAVLQREYCRVEDAYARLVEYRQYLSNQEQLLNDRYQKGHYDFLINKMAEPEPLLPAEWLYPGKLLLVEHADIGKVLPKFAHRLYFHNDTEAQQALAVESGDEFPVMITKRSKSGMTFYGCVARGKLLYEHILPCEPVSFEVDRRVQDVYEGKIFGPLIKARMRVVHCRQQNMTYLPGMRVDVYPYLYDHLLTVNPFQGGDNRSLGIEVSEFAPVDLDESGRQEIYMETDEALLASISDQRFYDPSLAWSLIDYDTEKKRITLGRASVLVECEADFESGMLVVMDVEQTAAEQLGYDLGFDVVLVSERLNVREVVGWQSGLAEFVARAIQATSDKEHMQQRRAAAEFMRRWETVTEYLLSMKHRTNAEFVATIEDISLDEEGRARLLATSIFSASAVANRANLRELFDAALNAEKPGAVPAKSYFIEYWDSARSQFVPAMKSGAKLWAEFERSGGNLMITGHFYPHLVGTEQRFRFSVHEYHAPLDRQRKALKDFFSDRLVNPAIKEAILSPATCRVPVVEGATAQEIRFIGKPTPSQQAAIRTALSATDLAVIQGPPGTGKTTVIVELLHQLIENGHAGSVLVVSQQNVAVDNAIERYMQSLESRKISGVGMVRIGGDLEKISRKVVHLSLDAVREAFILRLKAHAASSCEILSDEKVGIARAWAGFLDSCERLDFRDPSNEELFVSLLSGKQLVGATCVGLASRKAGVDVMSFDVVIIDEAGRSTVPELLIPMLRARKVVLIGDHYQLPPSIDPLLREDDSADDLAFLKETFLDTSFFEVLFEGVPEGCRSMLSEQFRMPPVIGDLVADLFYSRQGARTLQNGPSVYDRKDDIFVESLCWMDVDYGKQSKPDKSSSLLNKEEAKAIANFLTWLSENCSLARSVAVITPYLEQKKLLQKHIRLDNRQRLGNLEVLINTVDAFQGMEADLVCYSPVRTQGEIRFILDRKRLNVACSRAKKHLIFFGNRRFLSSCLPKDGKINYFSEISRRSVHDQITLCDGGKQWKMKG